jgi:hypothetical protein
MIGEAAFTELPDRYLYRAPPKSTLYLSHAADQSDIT